MTSRQNLEVKARCPDLAAARQAAHDLCGLPAIEDQVDTYFHVPRGRLKLREINGRDAVLIAYERADEAAARLSHYRLVPVPDPELLKTVLASSLGIRGCVRKHREIYLHHNVRIHLDEVAGLGSFLELEAVLHSAQDEAESDARLQGLLTLLQITPADLLAVSYADLLGFERGCQPFPLQDA
jgi:predicted adenylyl cyclase CyaB